MRPSAIPLAPGPLPSLHQQQCPARQHATERAPRPARRSSASLAARRSRSSAPAPGSCWRSSASLAARRSRCRSSRHALAMPSATASVTVRRNHRSMTGRIQPIKQATRTRPTQISSTPSATTAAEGAGRLPVVRAARHGTGLELLMEVEVELGHVVEALQCGERIVA